MPSYKIPCNGIVLGREFCHYRVDVPAATFYPSVWRLDGSSYKLIHTSNGSFVLQVLSGLTFACTRYIQPSLYEQFTVLTNDTVGLYSGHDASQILTSSSSKWYSYFLQYNRESRQHQHRRRQNHVGAIQYIHCSTDK